MQKFGKILAAMWTILVFQGCAQPDPQQESSEKRIESRYIEVIGEMTAVMSEHHEDPAQNLEALRVYVTGSRERIGGIVNELNRDYLGMDETARAQWHRSAREGIEKSLESYSRAQLKLSSRLDEAQKWELGEILAQLKK